MTVGSLIIELHEIPQGDQSQYTSLSLRILSLHTSVSEEENAELVADNSLLEK